MPRPRRTQIASADGDEISSALLHWSRMSSRWELHQEKLQNYSFLDDVIGRCTHVSVDSKESDGDFPGNAWVHYVVTTDNAKELRREIRAVVRELIAEGAVREAERLRMSERPTAACHLCTVDVWDDVLPNEYEYWIERDSDSRTDALWLRDGSMWKRKGIWESRAEGLREAATRMLKSLNHPPERIVSFELGDIVSGLDLESLNSRMKL